MCSVIDATLYRESEMKESGQIQRKDQDEGIRATFMRRDSFWFVAKYS